MAVVFGYDKHRRGAFALLVSTNGAMREPLGRGTGNRTGSTFCVYMADMKTTKSVLESAGTDVYLGPT